MTSVIARSRTVVASCVRKAIRRLLRLMPSRLAKVIVEESIASSHEMGRDFLTLRARSKSGDVANYTPADSIPARSTVHPAIILQGPLVAIDDFSLETVRYYRRFAPKSVVIVSTWSDESESELQKLRDLGAEVITSDRPIEPGRMNVNL